MRATCKFRQQSTPGAQLCYAELTNVWLGRVAELQDASLEAPDGVQKELQEKLQVYSDFAVEVQQELLHCLLQVCLQNRMMVHFLLEAACFIRV